MIKEPTQDRLLAKRPWLLVTAILT